MPHEPSETRTTLLLREAAAGNREAAEDLMPLVYDELRKLAAAWMARLAPGHTLQPTALVHEAYARLVGSADAHWESRRHFFFAAARAMQHILVEHARKRMALKRGGGARQVDLADCELSVDAPPEEILALDKALDKLKDTNPRMHTVVMLRYFAGLPVQETAQALGVNDSTVARDWRVARAWLFREIAGEGGASS